MSPDSPPPVALPFGAAYDRLQQVAAELGADATMAPDRLIALLREGKGLERALRDHLERVEQEVRAIEDGDGAVPYRIEDPAPRASTPGPPSAAPAIPAPATAAPATAAPAAPASAAPASAAPAPATPAQAIPAPATPAPASTSPAPGDVPGPVPTPAPTPPPSPTPAPAPPQAPTLGFPDDDDIPF